MAPISTWGPATVLFLGLSLMSAPPSVSAAPILHKQHMHRHLHRNVVVPEDDPRPVETSSTVFIDPTPVAEGLPDDGAPTAGTSTTRFVNYPLATPFASDPLRVEEDDQAPTVVLESIADRTRPLVHGSGVDIPPPPRPQNGPVKVATGLFERLTSRTRPLNKSVSYHSGVSNSAIVFFLAAVGFFLVSLLWNLYVRYGWVRDKAGQTDMDAVGAMRLGSLVGESRGKGGQKKTHRSPGGWLRAANATPAPVAAV